MKMKMKMNTNQKGVGSLPIILVLLLFMAGVMTAIEKWAEMQSRYAIARELVDGKSLVQHQVRSLVLLLRNPEFMLQQFEGLEAESLNAQLKACATDSCNIPNSAAIAYSFSIVDPFQSGPGSPLVLAGAKPGGGFARYSPKGMICSDADALSPTLCPYEVRLKFIPRCNTPAAVAPCTPPTGLSAADEAAWIANCQAQAAQSEGVCSPARTLDVIVEIPPYQTFTVPDVANGAILEN